MFRCFLSHKLQQIKQVVDGILKSIFKFHALLRLGHWEEDESGQFIHTEYESIIKTYLPFKEFTQFLNKGKHYYCLLYPCVISKVSWTNSWLYFQGPNCKILFFIPAKFNIDSKFHTNIFGYIWNMNTTYAVVSNLMLLSKIAKGSVILLTHIAFGITTLTFKRSL